MSFDPDWTIAPGETLREWMKEKGLPLRALATICGRMDPKRLERILDGKQRITRDDARRLEAGTQIPASLWLRLERRYRADLKAGKTDASRKKR